MPEFQAMIGYLFAQAVFAVPQESDQLHAGYSDGHINGYSLAVVV
ncbi:hypothetical protein [Pseudomonas cerasi]